MVLIASCLYEVDDPVCTYTYDFYLFFCTLFLDMYITVYLVGTTKRYPYLLYKIKKVSGISSCEF